MTKEEVTKLQRAMNRFTDKFLENFPPIIVNGDRGKSTNRRISECKIYLGYKGGAQHSHRVTQLFLKQLKNPDILPPEMKELAEERRRKQHELARKLSDLVPIPPLETVNKNLSPVSEAFMLERFGKPGPLTKDCSPPTGKVLKRLKSGVDVGPFSVSGMDFAVSSLAKILAEVEVKRPRLFKELKTEGMLCCRARRKDKTRFSNHSWGAAIDLFFGTRVVDQGTHEAHRGIVLLVPFFNRHGWYWGGEFSGEFVDTMHFELAAETIDKIT